MGLFNSGIRPAVDEWLLAKSKEVRNYGEYWSASSAGYCMRRVIFERLGVPKVESTADARKQRVFTSGHLFHSWLQGITKEAGLSIAQELELQDEELMIRGHIDDLVLLEGVCHACAGTGTVGVGAYAEACFCNKGREQHLILYDFKTVNSRAFLWAKKNGGAMSHYHKMQLGTYMYMLRKNGWAPNPQWKKSKMEGDTTVHEARILKIEKDTLMMMEQQLLWSPELEKEVYSYWSTLNGYWQSKKMPKCTCGDYEGGFLGKEAYNGFFYNGEPCSLEYYEKWKSGQAVDTTEEIEPVKYSELDPADKKALREKYIKAQDEKCYYCQETLYQPAPERITSKKIDWSKFPKGFLDYPIHLQHNHTTDMTEGAVHNYCNAVMWQYEGR